MGRPRFRFRVASLLSQYFLEKRGEKVFYRNEPPSKRAETQVVEIQVQVVLPTGEKTYELEWIETARSLSGQLQGEPLFSVAAFGQNSGEQSKPPSETEKPVELKRTAPAGSIPAPDKYPIEMMIRSLNQNPPEVPIPNRMAQSTPPAPAGTMEVPKDFKLPKEGSLSDTGKDALEAGQTWLMARNTPTEDSIGHQSTSSSKFLRPSYFSTLTSESG